MAVDAVDTIMLDILIDIIDENFKFLKYDYKLKTLNIKVQKCKILYE